MDTVLPFEPVLIPFEARRARAAPKPTPATRQPATSPDPGALARQQAADVAALRRAAQSLADSARALAALGGSMHASVQRLGEHRATLAAETTRGRRIAADADAIERAINSGSLDAMLALRKRMAEQG